MPCARMAPLSLISSPDHPESQTHPSHIHWSPLPEGPPRNPTFNADSSAFFQTHSSLESPVLPAGIQNARQKTQRHLSVLPSGTCHVPPDRSYPPPGPQLRCPATSSLLTPSAWSPLTILRAFALLLQQSCHNMLRMSSHRSESFHGFHAPRAKPQHLKVPPRGL